MLDALNHSLDQKNLRLPPEHEKYIKELSINNYTPTYVIFNQTYCHHDNPVNLGDPTRFRAIPLVNKDVAPGHALHPQVPPTITNRLSGDALPVISQRIDPTQQLV